MARPKEFDESKALQAAMMLFWEKGYEATSMQNLVHRMGVNRASLYATYGDKHSLFLKALQRYDRSYGYQPLLERASQGSPLGTLKDFFAETIHALTVPAVRKRGCLMQNTALELGPHDIEVGKLLRENFRECQATFTKVLNLARERGEIKKSAEEIHELGIFLFANLSAIRALAKTGSSEQVFNAVAKHALAALD